MIKCNCKSVEKDCTRSSLNNGATIQGCPPSAGSGILGCATCVYNLIKTNGIELSRLNSAKTAFSENFPDGSGLQQPKQTAISMLMTLGVGIFLLVAVPILTLSMLLAEDVRFGFSLGIMLLISVALIGMITIWQLIYKLNVLSSEVFSSAQNYTNQIGDAVTAGVCAYGN